jgi:signal transduction histidine kinase/ActR/RegA family two-component response regulator
VNVFVELFKKTRQIKRQAQLLKQQNQEIKNANLERLRSLIDLGHQLAAEHEPPAVLRRFCRSAQRVIDAEEVTIVMLGDDEQTPRYFFRCDRNGRIHERGAIPEVIQPALRQVLIELAPVRLDESSELLIDDDLNPIETFLGAPILSAGVILGWFYLLNRRGEDHFSESDESLAATLANHVAVAYENARLYAEAQNHATELRMEMAVRRQAEEERAHLLVREQAARAEAEAANKNKDEFLATLSHELRTPLTAILGWSHLLRTKKLNEPETNRALDTIERNARSQSQLIDDLLDVSRIITGKLSIDRARVDLSKVIDGALDVTRPLSEAKDIQFTIAIELSPCFVLGDSTRLQQVFWNLFSNAVKFTPKGGQVFIVSSSTDSRVTVAVTDTGIGIKPELLPFIFDRFRQGDGSTTREHGGLGLGLAIVRHLVQLHGGTVEVESDGIACGSTFKVTFPLAIEDILLESNQSEIAPAQSLSPPALSLQPLQGIKVLVVDDEYDSRELLTMILTRCGSDVRCSDSAAHAIEEFNEWHPDLLVSDIGMPYEDGYSLIQKVRSLDSNYARQIPAVALTAYATDEDRMQALSAGFQMHVPKPIEPESFLSSLASVLGREQKH